MTKLSIKEQRGNLHAWEGDFILDPRDQGEDQNGRTVIVLANDKPVALLWLADDADPDTRRHALGLGAEMIGESEE